MDSSGKSGSSAGAPGARGAVESVLWVSGFVLFDDMTLPLRKGIVSNVPYLTLVELYQSALGRRTVLTSELQHNLIDLGNQISTGKMRS